MHHPTRNSPEAAGAQGLADERGRSSVQAACGAQAPRAGSCPALCAGLLAELGVRPVQEWGLEWRPLYDYSAADWGFKAKFQKLLFGFRNSERHLNMEDLLI